MFPFSVTQKTAVRTGPAAAQGGYELIAFDAERLNVFTARVSYCEPHWHPAPELITVLSGCYILAVNEQLWRLMPGDMLYINAEAVHSLSAEEENSELLTVQFSPLLFDNAHPAPVIRFCTSERAQGAAERLVMQRLVELVAHLVSNGAPFLRTAAVYMLLDALVKAGVADTVPENSLREAAIFKKGLNYINQNFDRPLSLSEVASHTGTSYSWFSRLFKKVSRYNFKTYLTLVRLNKARIMLCDTHAPITQISHSCGFQEHKYLIAAFKKHCGLTPTEYRKRYFSRQFAIDTPSMRLEDRLCLPLNAQLLARLDALNERKPAG